MKKLIYFLAFILIVHCILKIEDCMSQWQPDVRLTNDPNNSYSSHFAVYGSMVHVAWTDWRDGNNEIYYKRSTNAGVSWGADTRLTNNTEMSFSSSIAVSGSVVHIVWYDYRDGNYEIYYKRSTDAGISWSADTRLTNNFAESSYPSVAVSGSVVHVVWEDSRDGMNNWEIYYKRSTDAGLSWTSDIRITNNAAGSLYPSIAVSGLVLHVIWYDTRVNNDKGKIYYKRSTDAGISWGADTRLTNDTAHSENSSIAVSGSDVHVVWNDYLNWNRDIYYKRSTDAGVSWGADTRLTNNTATSWFPSVAVSGSFVHIVWEDNLDPEIYYKRSTDAGVSWGEDTRLTNNANESKYPSVAVSGSAVHVVWTDHRDGNDEIYYKRNPTGNPIAIKNITSEIPSSYSLYQNYPNPFNPTTKIKFDIAPSLSFPNAPIGNPLVVLKVFDILGKEIATLVNEQLAPGTYTVDFDGSNYSSGIYFYRLETPDFVQTNKMILLK